MSHATGAAAPHRKPFLWIMLLSAAPFVLATLLYVGWTPGSLKTDGVFLDPKAPLAATDLRDASGQAAPLLQLRGKWLLVMATTGACDQACSNTLYRMRQVRMAQGEYMQRIERIWLSVKPADALFGKAQADGTRVRVDGEGQLLKQLPAGREGVAGAVWLIDPNGNLVMRYDAAVDPVKMIRELKRIIKINNGLG